MKPASPAVQVCHQLHTDWQRDRLWVLAFIVFLILRLWYRTEPWWHESVGRLGEPTWLTWLAYLTPAALAMRVIMADAPANRNLGIHTRPISRSALLAAKGLFLLLAIVLPKVLCDAWLWRGFDHDARTLTFLLAGSVIEIGIVLLPSMVMAAASESGTQLALIILGCIITLVLAGESTDHFYRALNERLREHEDSLTGHPSTFMAALPEMLAALLLITAWLMQSLTRRRVLALSLLVVAIVMQTHMILWLRLGWQGSDDLKFTASQLTLKIGKVDAGNHTPVQTLWPALHVEGLPPDYLASVISFAPQGVWAPQARAQPGKAQACWSDYDYALRDGYSVRLREQQQVLFKYYGPTDLWFGRSSQVLRAPLNSVIAPHPPAAPWQLRLAVHELHKVFDRSLMDFINDPPTLLLSTGWQMRFHSVRDEGSALRIPWHLRSQHFTLSTGRPVMHNHDGPLALPHAFTCLAVIQDTGARENTLLTPENEGAEQDRSGGWIDDHALGYAFYISKPLARMSMTGLKQTDWTKQVRLQLWVPEERGTVDFQLSPSQLAEALKDTGGQPALSRSTAVRPGATP